MHFARPEKRPHPETIVALIDVVFFLLVFALLTGRMDATAPYDIAPPKAKTGADLPSGGVSIAINTDGAIALNGIMLTEDDLLQKSADLLARAPNTRFQINTDGRTRLALLMPVVQQLRLLGAENIVLIVTPGDL